MITRPGVSPPCLGLPSTGLLVCAAEPPDSPRREAGWDRTHCTALEIKAQGGLPSQAYVVTEPGDQRTPANPRSIMGLFDLRWVVDSVSWLVWEEVIEKTILPLDCAFMFCVCACVSAGACVHVGTRVGGHCVCVCCVHMETGGCQWVSSTTLSCFVGTETVSHEPRPH